MNRGQDVSSASSSSLRGTRLVRRRMRRPPMDAYMAHTAAPAPARPPLRPLALATAHMPTACPPMLDISPQLAVAHERLRISGSHGAEDARVPSMSRTSSRPDSSRSQRCSSNRNAPGGRSLGLPRLLGLPRQIGQPSRETQSNARKLGNRGNKGDPGVVLVLVWCWLCIGIGSFICAGAGAGLVLY